MPRRRVAFNFQKRSKKRDSRPNVYAGAEPGPGDTAGTRSSERAPAREEAAVARPAARRAGGRARARSVIYTEFLRQELVKFAAVTLVLLAIVIAVSILYQ